MSPVGVAGSGTFGIPLVLACVCVAVAVLLVGGGPRERAREVSGRRGALEARASQGSRDAQGSRASRGSDQISRPTLRDSRNSRRTRAAPEQPPAVLDVGVVLTLAHAALAAGTSVPGTLVALGNCAHVPELKRAGTTLLLGGTWSEAVEDVPDRLRPLVEALAPAWESGADPTQLLAQAARTVTARRARATKEAAARLGVRLVLPLGLCFLPAFVLVGLVPVVLSITGDLLGGTAPFP